MKIYFVDSFTTQPFKGNPAAVCLTNSALPNSTMQSIATEIGFSETAFVLATKTENRFHIRYFSPKKEIPLCGHATLAAAKILFGQNPFAEIVFVNVQSLELPVSKAGEKICMQFPVYETEPITIPQSMLTALGIPACSNTVYSQVNKIILLEISSAPALAALHPDFNALIQSYTGINGVLVTAPGNTPDFDFHYRYFWPWAGTNEDPVTGGVQTFLTKYWSNKLNKTKFNAFQSSARTGQMMTELKVDKVLIYGDAVIVLEGELKLNS